jgi:Xaa-Pro aminopeptidase
MKVDFPSDFFANNRQKLKELVGPKLPIIITANSLLQKGIDSAYPFHQDANFWYLSGINDPEIVLVLAEDRDFLILPKRSNYQNTFEGIINQKALTKISGVGNILSFEAGWQQLDSLLLGNKQIAALRPLASYLETYGMYTNPARQQLVKRLRQANKKLQIKDISLDLARLRMIKQTGEIAAISSAVDITTAAIGAVRSKISQLSHEYSLEAVITAHFLDNNVDNAWKPIIASGHNACILHYNDNASRLMPNDLVTIDIGAEVSHYAADITRTLLIGSKPSARQLSVYRAVAEVQDFAVKLQKPGSLIADNEQRIRKFMASKLIQLGLIKRLSDDAVSRFYPHATSHFLGLEAHDAGDYKQPLQPGVVLTVEPGIYIPEENIGIRLEDDVLITSTGNKVLSANSSRDLL